MVGVCWAPCWVGLVSQVCGADPPFSSTVWNWCGSSYAIGEVWVPPLWYPGYLVTYLQLTQGTMMRKANCHPAVTSLNSTRTRPPTHTHPSFFPRWFCVTLMWSTNSLSRLNTFPVWSACDTQEHLIPVKKQEERGQVKKRKEQGGPLFFKNQMKQWQPYLFSGTGTPEAAASSPVWDPVAPRPLETGPRGVMSCWLSQSRLVVPGSVARSRPVETPCLGLPC